MKLIIIIRRKIYKTNVSAIGLFQIFFKVVLNAELLNGSFLYLFQYILCYSWWMRILRYFKMAYITDKENKKRGRRTDFDMIFLTSLLSNKCDCHNEPKRVSKKHKETLLTYIFIRQKKRHRICSSSAWLHTICIVG